MSSVEEKQEHFYNSIAHYYSHIFPFNPAQLTFLEREKGDLKDMRFLDAGCGAGELVFELAQKGAWVSAIDLNEELLNQARMGRNHERITYQKGNMLDISGLFGCSVFDGVICFGNTLVHLESSAQILDFFRSVYGVLNPGGRFFLQILHYDHIFREKVETLPLIENEQIRFDRGYRFIPGSRKIRFLTRLTVKATGESIENETELLGVGCSELISYLQEAGFREISLFADFTRHPFGGNHLPLVVSTLKSRDTGRE